MDDLRMKLCSNRHFSDADNAALLSQVNVGDPVFLDYNFERPVAFVTDVYPDVAIRFNNPKEFEGIIWELGTCAKQGTPPQLMYLGIYPKPMEYELGESAGMIETLAPVKLDVVETTPDRKGILHVFGQLLAAKYVVSGIRPTQDDFQALLATARDAVDHFNEVVP